MSDCRSLDEAVPIVLSVFGRHAVEFVNEDVHTKFDGNSRSRLKRALVLRFRKRKAWKVWLTTQPHSLMKRASK